MSGIIVFLIIAVAVVVFGVAEVSGQRLLEQHVATKHAED
jgi:hypothetical protein